MEGGMNNVISLLKNIENSIKCFQDLNTRNETDLLIREEVYRLICKAGKRGMTLRELRRYSAGRRVMLAWQNIALGPEMRVYRKYLPNKLGGRPRMAYVTVD
jgi:hypothetical protein